MKLQKKSVSKIALTDLLRRKRTNLTKYLSDNGIFSYELLLARCLSIGVIPPTEDQFLKARGVTGLREVSSPTEGIVVLNPQLESQLDHSTVTDTDNVIDSFIDHPLELQESSENVIHAAADGAEISRPKRKKKSLSSEEES